MNKLFFYCYISSNSGLFLVFGTFLDFDTSHVKVYRAAGFEPAWLSDNFKTSHVKVYRSCAFLALSILCNFKTSHVKVYLKPGTDVICRYAISKHLMLKFIQRISCISYSPLYQIPQYLSTFLKFLPATAPFAKKIYKITAMPLFLRIHAILH